MLEIDFVHLENKLAISNFQPKISNFKFSAQNFQKKPFFQQSFTDGNIEKNWYLLVLFHQATDSFLHLITSEQDLFVETKKPWARKLQNYIKYVLGMAYPVIYSYTLTMIMIEYMFRAVCMKSVAEKVKKHRKDWEEVFDDTWVLNFVQWCSNVWFFVALLTYIISYFGAGFVNWDACFCNPDHTVRLKKKFKIMFANKI